MTFFWRCSMLLTTLAAAACATTSSGGVASANQRDVLFDETLGTIRTDAFPAAGPVSIPAPPDRTWDAIMGAYATVGVEVKHLNRPSGELGNRDVRISRRLGNSDVSKYLDCGADPFNGPVANSSPIRASLVTRMRPSGTVTTIETMFSGSIRKPGFSEIVHCSSTGALEKLIAASVFNHITEPAK